MNPIKTNNLPKILLNNPLLLFSLLFGQICFSNLLIGQSDSAKFEQYPFVHYELNHFTGSENSIAFNAFYEKFDRMMRFKTGKLNIVHFGGSHIQADIWSNYLRERLQTIDTNVQGARGIVFPFKAAGTNAPYSYSVNTQGQWDGFRSSYNKHESTWGVSGITATTSDTLAGLKFTFERPLTTSRQINLPC